MHHEERRYSDKLVMQYLPSRYGMNPYDLKKADMIEIGAGQGREARHRRACCWGSRCRTRWRRCATCPRAWTSAAPAAHPDSGWGPTIST